MYVTILLWGIVPRHCQYQIQLCSTYLQLFWQLRKNVKLDTVAKGDFLILAKIHRHFLGNFFSQNGVLVNFTKKIAQDIYRITSCYISMTQIAELDIFTGTGIKFEAVPPSWRTRTWLNLYGASRFQSLNRKQVVFVICIFLFERVTYISIFM